jgi:hypothetical protein
MQFRRQRRMIFSGLPSLVQSSHHSLHAWRPLNAGRSNRRSRKTGIPKGHF